MADDKTDKLLSTLQKIPSSIISQTSKIFKYQRYKSIFDKTVRIIDILNYNRTLRRFEKEINYINRNNYPELRNYFKTIFDLYHNGRLNNWYINNLRDIQNKISDKVEVERINSHIEDLMKKGKDYSNNAILVAISKDVLDKHRLVNISNLQQINDLLSKLLENVDFSIIDIIKDNRFANNIDGIIKYSEAVSNKYPIIKIIKSSIDEFITFITSSIFFNSVWLISSVISFVTATATGILPLVSLVGTIVVIFSSFVTKINTMKNYKNLVEECEYLDEFIRLNEKKSILLSKFNMTLTPETLYIKNREHNEKYTIQVTWLRSALKVFRDNIPDNIRLLALNIITFNPLSTTIAFFNSVISHTLSVINRKNNDEKKLYIKEKIKSLAKNKYCPEYNNLQELKNQYSILKAEYQILEKSDLNEDKNIIIKKLSDARENVQRENNKGISFKDYTYNLLSLLDPFYEKDKIKLQAQENFLEYKKPLNTEKSTTILPIIIKAIRDSSITVSSILGLEYLFGNTIYDTQPIITGLIGSTAISQATLSSINNINDTKEKIAATEISSIKTSKKKVEVEVEIGNIQTIIKEFNLTPLSLIESPKDIKTEHTSIAESRKLNDNIQRTK